MRNVGGSLSTAASGRQLHCPRRDAALVRQTLAQRVWRATEVGEDGLPKPSCSVFIHTSSTKKG